MTEQINDGGSAFPHDDVWEGGRVVPPREPGMTLRDWFAGQASETDIAAHRVTKRNIAGHPLDAPGSREDARYRYADAMLAARVKP